MPTMTDDEKMFQWGVGILVVVLVVSAVLQVAFRTQDKTQIRVRAQIRQTQKDYSLARADFSALVRPESLRSSVSMVHPEFTAVGFTKTVSAGDIPLGQ